MSVLKMSENWKIRDRNETTSSSYRRRMTTNHIAKCTLCEWRVYTSNTIMLSTATGNNKTENIYSNIGRLITLTFNTKSKMVKRATVNKIRNWTKPTWYWRNEDSSDMISDKRTTHWIFVFLSKFMFVFFFCPLRRHRRRLLGSIRFSPILCRSKFFVCILFYSSFSFFRAFSHRNSFDYAFFTLILSLSHVQLCRFDCAFFFEWCAFVRHSCVVSPNVEYKWIRHTIAWQVPKAFYWVRERAYYFKRMKWK